MKKTNCLVIVTMVTLLMLCGPATGTWPAVSFAAETSVPAEIHEMVEDEGRNFVHGPIHLPEGALPEDLLPGSIVVEYADVEPAIGSVKLSFATDRGEDGVSVGENILQFDVVAMDDDFTVGEFRYEIQPAPDEKTIVLEVEMDCYIGSARVHRGIIETVTLLSEDGKSLSVHTGYGQPVAE